MGDRLYRLACPRCSTSTVLPLATLEGITQHRPARRADDHLLFLVCPECKAVFECDWRQQEVAATDEPRQTAAPQFPPAFFLVAECGDLSCYSRSTIVAIRDSGATTEDFLAEYPEWTVDGICCEQGHPIVLPDSSDLLDIREP